MKKKAKVPRVRKSPIKCISLPADICEWVDKRASETGDNFSQIIRQVLFKAMHAKTK